MLTLPKPPFSVLDVLAGSGSGARIRSLLGIGDVLLRVEREYESSAVDSTLHMFATSYLEISQGHTASLRWVYSARVARKDRPGRSFYNSLRAAAPRGRCPLCLHREVGALDHYLPKSQYPHLAVTPLNLVPICVVCNGKKGSYVSMQSVEQPLHPYFDDLGGADWLVCVLHEVVGAPLTFGSSAPQYWSRELAARVTHHFTRLELNDLYSANAATLLGNIRLQLARALDFSGPTCVRDLLCEMAVSYRSNGAEPWSVVSLEAWAKSDWFCEGGFLA